VSGKIQQAVQTTCAYDGTLARITGFLRIWTVSNCKSMAFKSVGHYLKGGNQSCFSAATVKFANKLAN
jgi:hypothetical protein